MHGPGNIKKNYLPCIQLIRNRQIEGSHSVTRHSRKQYVVFHRLSKHLNSGSRSLQYMNPPNKRPVMEDS
jgi:hypothetical protein